MADYYQLETTTDHFLLEDGSGSLLIDAPIPYVPDSIADEFAFSLPFMWSMGLLPKAYLAVEFDQFNFAPAVGFGGTNISSFRGYWSLRGAMGLEFEMNFGFQPSGAGYGQNLMGFKGFWSLRAAMGSEIDNIQFTPPVVVTAITPFDEDQFPLRSILLLDNDPDFGFQTPGAGGGIQMGAYKGWTARAGMMSEFEVPFALPVVVTAITPFDEDQFLQALNLRYQDDDVFGFQTPVVTINLPWDTEFNPVVSVSGIRQEDELQNFIEAFVVDVDQNPTSIQSMIQGTDEDTVQSTFFALEQFGEVQEIPIPQQLSFYNRSLESDQDTSHSTFFSLEQFADVDVQTLYKQDIIQYEIEPPTFVESFVVEDNVNPLALNFTYQDDEQFSFQTPVVQVVTAFDENQNPLKTQSILQSTDEDTSQSTFFALEQYSDNDLQMLPYPTPKPFADDLFVFGVLVGFLPAMPYDAEFNPQQMKSYYNPSLDTDLDTSQSTFFAREQYADVEEQFNTTSRYALDVDEQFGFQTPAVITNLPWDTESNPVIQSQVISDSVELFGYDTIAITDVDQSPNVLGKVSVDVELFGYETVAVVDVDQTPYVLNVPRSIVQSDAEAISVFVFQKFLDADEQSPLWPLPTTYYEGTDQLLAFIQPPPPTFIPGVNSVNVAALLDIVESKVLSAILQQGLVTTTRTRMKTGALLDAELYVKGTVVTAAITGTLGIEQVPLGNFVLMEDGEPVLMEDDSNIILMEDMISGWGSPWGLFPWGGEVE